MKDRTTMEYKGFYARIMEAPRLIGDRVHSLPPGEPLEVYGTDEFVEYPSNWMSGQGCFVVGVRPNKGLWFDWRLNSEVNTAVLPTVKGCNPITGLQTSGFHLEKYENKCPKHGCDFQGERYCPECDYQWPDRNYVSGSPSWWDGFRAGGDVRQFFFTEEELRDVATHLIGKENTVPAFGFAFYRPKEMREERASSLIYSDCLSWLDGDTLKFNNPLKLYSDYSMSTDTASVKIHETYTSGGIITPPPKLNEEKVTYSNSGTGTKAYLASAGVASMGQSEQLSEAGQSRGTMRCVSKSLNVAPPKKEVSVGAGARISQTLPYDPYPLDSWKDAPEACMTIYFVFQEQLEEMKAKGMRDLKGKKEGMLEGLPVG